MRLNKWHSVLLGLFIAVFTISVPLTASAADKTIIFGDLSWDSVMVHNRIAAFIIKHGYGYDSRFVPGSTPVIVKSVMKGDVDVDMESWTQNIQDLYDEGIESGQMLDLGPCYPDSWQGWLVPTYVIEGDPERGIEASAPDLKTVQDMAKYWELFKDPEDPSKGRFYNGIAGWSVTEKNSIRLKAYGLDEYYNDFIPGSDAALSGSMVAAYQKGKPWFGYYWGPTWILGKLDMTPLEEPPYDPEVWNENYACTFPPVDVNILVHKDLPETAPEVVELLKNYETTLAMNNKFLAFMKDFEGDDAQQAAAEWFLKNYEAVWTGWVPAEVAEKVKAAL